MRHVDLGVYCCQCVRVCPDSILGKVWGNIVAVFLSIQHRGLRKMLELPTHREKCVCADQDIYYLGSRNHFFPLAPLLVSGFGSALVQVRCLPN